MILLSKAPVVIPNKPINPRFHLRLAENHSTDPFKTRELTNEAGEKFISNSESKRRGKKSGGTVFVSIHREDGRFQRCALFLCNQHALNISIDQIYSPEHIGYHQPEKTKRGRGIFGVVLTEALIVAATEEYSKIVLLSLDKIALLRHYFSYGFEKVPSKRLNLTLSVMPTLTPFI